MLFYLCLFVVVCYHYTMKVREWAELNGLNVQTVWKWCRENRMPVPFERTETGTILIHDPRYETASVATGAGRTVCYARVSSAELKDDLQRQVDRLKAFAIGMGIVCPEVVVETGSGIDERRREINRLLADPTVTAIIVERRDRLACANAGLVESALKAQGRSIIVVDDTENKADLECDMEEILASFCVRLYGRRSAQRRARAALQAVRDA